MTTSHITQPSICGISADAGAAAALDRRSSRHVFVNGSMMAPATNRLQAFQRAAEQLRCHGYTVTNPVELAIDNPLSKEACLRSDIVALLACDTVALLPDWHKSNDAQLLTNIAARLGMRIYGVSALLSQKPGGAA